ncbi:MAG: hypothetical protein AB7S44_02850 [Spirochaetales bacterium]
MKIVTTKMVNVFTIFLTAIFALSTLVATISSIYEDSQITLEFEQMMQDVNEFNYNHAISIYDPATVDEETDSTEQLFYNAADTFVTSYNNTFYADSYYVISRGTSFNTVKTLGIEIQTYSQNIMIKYLDGSAIYELISYEPGNKYGRTIAKQIYYNSATNLVYIRTTENVVRSGNDLITTYTSANTWVYDTIDYFQEAVGIFPGQPIYDYSISAVIEQSFFKAIKVNGVVTEYQAQVLNNPAMAGKNYRKVIKYMADSSTIPTISQMKASAIVGADGSLITLTLSDKYVVKVKVVGDVYCDSTASYYIMPAGDQISFAKPDTTGAVKNTGDF